AVQWFPARHLPNRTRQLQGHPPILQHKVLKLLPPLLPACMHHHNIQGIHIPTLSVLLCAAAEKDCHLRHNKTASDSI
ncbi:MAG: hypothetical protein IJ528_06880, partial [Bacteroidaceae bacterium]|nr:hypothetical protein [Bacteroidaceae bacterium]